MEAEVSTGLEIASGSERFCSRRIQKSSLQELINLQLLFYSCETITHLLSKWQP